MFLNFVCVLFRESEDEESSGGRFCEELGEGKSEQKILSENVFQNIKK